MSDSYRRLNTAIGVTLALALGACLFMAGLSYEPNEGTDNKQAAQQEQSEASIARATPTPPANPRPKRNEWREERDLQAQREMAQWAFWMVVVSGVGVVITGAGVWLVRETLIYTAEQSRAALIQANVARDQFLYSKKPTLRVGVVEHDIHIALDPEKTQPIHAEIYVENVAGGIATFEECPIELSIQDSLAPAPDVGALKHHVLYEPAPLAAGARQTIPLATSGEVTPELGSEVINGRRHVYLVGILHYRDENYFSWEMGFAAEAVHLGPNQWNFEFYPDETHRFDRPARKKKNGEAIDRVNHDRPRKG